MVQFLDDGLEGEALLSGESGGAADGILGVSLVTVRGMLEYGTTSSIGNYTGVSTSEGFYYFPTRWEPLHEPDYVMLVFTAVHQLVMLAVVVHLVWRRDWPPYVTKKITLVGQ